VRGNHQPFPRKGNTWLPEEKSVITGQIHRNIVDSKSGLLKLVQTESRNERLWVGPRIGLSAKRDRKNPEGKSFRDAPLRIATWPTVTKKTAMDSLP
jgi:hypothetical protein